VPGLTEPAKTPWSSDRVAFVNGQFVEECRATLSIFDRGVLYGDAVFEAAFAWDGYIFKLDRHLRRMDQALRAVCIDLPVSLEELKGYVIETVRRNRLRDAYIKWIVTRGVGPGILLDPIGCVPSIIVMAREYLFLTDPQKAQTGIRVKIAQVRRTPHECLDPRIKSVGYLNLILARIEAMSGRYDDALLLDMQGRLCEAPGYNLFVAREGVVRTPAEEVLEGITRETVLELCRELHIPAAEDDLMPYDAYTADELFLTNTAGGIVPVISVDGRRVGAGVPGPICQRVRDAYRSLIESRIHGTGVYGA